MRKIIHTSTKNYVTREDLDALPLKDRAFFSSVCDRGLLPTKKQWGYMYAVLRNLAEKLHINICGYKAQRGIYDITEHVIHNDVVDFNKNVRNRNCDSNAPPVKAEQMRKEIAILDAKIDVLLKRKAQLEGNNVRSASRYSSKDAEYDGEIVRGLQAPSEPD